MEDLKRFLKETYHLVAESIEAIEGGLVNTNYHVTTSSGVYVVKRYNQKSIDEARFETDFLQALARSAFPSPRLVASRTGNVLTEFEGQPCVVYHYIVGSPLRTISEPLLKEIGVLIAQLHVASRDFKPRIAKPTWEIDALKKLASDSSESLISRGYAHAAELRSFMLSELERFDFSPALPIGITHQDIKPENILIEEGRISGIVDFDNSYCGTLLDDITTAIIWMCFEGQKFVQPRVDALLEGYESVRPLETKERESLSDRIRFRLLREVFISPYAATKPQEAHERSEYFKKLYKNFAT